VQRSLQSLTVLVIAVVAMSTLFVASASAQQYPPQPAYGVTCSVDGPTVSCTVVGADAGEQLAATAICDGTVRHNMTLVADRAGEAAFSFVANSGACEVSVLRASSGTATTTVSAGSDAEAAGAPVAGGTSGQLPLTGGEVGLLLLAGILLLAGGLVTLRRREDARVSAVS
jgi:LPXTG-motif cell wall-anchored protein